MAFTFLAGKSDALGVNGGTSSSFDSTGGNLLIVGVACYNAVGVVAGDISDNKSNSFQQLGGDYDGNECEVEIYYVVGPNVGTGHTITITKSASYSSLVAAVFSGSGSTDLSDGNGGVGLNSIAPASGITPSASGALVISIAQSEGLDGFTGAPSGYTLVDDQVFKVDGNNFGISLAYKIIGAPALEQPEWTASTPVHALSTIVGSFLSTNPATPRLRGITQSNLIWR